MKIPAKLMKPVLSLVNKRDGDLRLLICNGNIIEANTSTIVNSVNTNLANNGGVAKAIEDAAGKAYKDACEKLPKPLDANKVYLTTSGSIDCCQSIINVVAPVYRTDLTKADLMVKYRMCIDEALKNNYESIAFPLLGAGIYGWPIDLSLSALVECVNNYTGFKRLKEVYLVDFNPASFREILDSINMNLNKYSNLSVEYNYSKQQQQQQQPVIMRPPSRTLNTEVETKWYWMDASEQWKEYRSEIARELTRQKNNNVNLFDITIDNKRYRIDLINKLQINAKTGYTRILLDQRKFAISTKSYAQWSWIEYGNRKQPYGMSDNKKIEHAFKQKLPYIDLVFKRHRDDLDNQYRIDFGRMQQINMKTGYSRPIIREKCEVPVQVISESNEDEDDENSLADDSNDKITYKIWFVGKRENLNTALREFDSKINAINCKDKIEQQNLSELPEDELKSNGFRAKKWSKNGVEIKQCGDSIELSGKVKRDVFQVKEELTRMFLKKNNIEYSSYWDLTKNKSENYCELIDVGSTPERAQIEAEFKATLPNNQIIGIKRIQNTRIYKYYYEEKNYLLNKSKKRTVNEVFLWHGTRNVPPSTVYSSDRCGLDFHHSNEGLWGRGIYLAKNASFSNSYSHTLQDGSKQFLFCSVLIGESVKLPADNSLRLPPFKDQMSGSGERYGSIEGFTGGSQIFIVYENQKVYPAYLITYK